MKAIDIFGLVIRLLGLTLMFYGLWYLSYGLAQIAGMPTESTHATIAYFAAGVPALFFGIVFFFFARWIVRFSYPKGQADSQSDVC